MARISIEARRRILDFVDSVDIGDAIGVWLTGSRAIGTNHAYSDWDVVVFTPHMGRGADTLFRANLYSKLTLEGGYIELIFAHPEHWLDTRRYMRNLRRSGIRLR